MESYPFDDVTPEPAAAPDQAPGTPTGHAPSRGRRIATGVAIGVAVLATGGVAIAATHTGSTTAQGGPGGGGPSGPGGPGGSGGASGTAGQGGPGGGFGGPPGTTSNRTAPGSTTSNGGTTSNGTTTTGTTPGGTTSGNTAGSGAAPVTGSGATAPQQGARVGGGPGAAGGLAEALHGTFVVPATSGTGTTTEDLRTGKVTAVNATSIAVASTDSTAGTFAVTSATTVNRGASAIGDVKVGDTVTVTATDADNKALSIEDRSLTSANGPTGGGHGGMPGGGPGGMPGTAGGTGTAPAQGGETT